jgi:hypothetical protein
MYCSAHVFILNDASSNQVSFQEDEVQAFKWVSMKQLVNPTNLSLRKETNLSSSFATYFPGPLTPIWKSFQRNYVSCSLPQVNLEMNEQLWGLTLYIIYSLLCYMKHHSVEIALPVNEFISHVDFDFNKQYVLGTCFK